MIAFGPVPSRRLGRSLGVNNVPLKSCTYSCVYCQLGRTPATEFERRKFYDPEEVLKDVEKRISDTRKAGEAPVEFRLESVVVQSGQIGLAHGGAMHRAGSPQLLADAEKVMRGEECGVDHEAACGHRQ